MSDSTRSLRHCLLSEIANLVDCEHKTAPKVSSGNFYSVRTTDISNGKIHFESANRVSEETYEEWTKRAIPSAGDIILAREAPVGEVGWIEAGYMACLGQRTVLIKVTDEEVSNRFLLYYLVNPDTKYALQARSAGSVVSHLNMKDIRGFEVQLPTISEQKSIASILSSLDDKIDLLHRQNKTLESMAETLFRQWFVEREGDTCPISELIEFNPPRKLAKGSLAPYVEMSALSTTTFSPDSWYLREFSSGTKFTNGDTLLARITPCLENGKAAYICFLKEHEVAWGSTEYIVMKPRQFLDPFFAYALSRNRDFRDYAEGCLEGSSGRQRVNVDHLKNYQLVKPSDETTMLFNSFASSITPKLHANSRQLKSLEKLRDTLLPKLMSGEVRVS